MRALLLAVVGFAVFAMMLPRGDAVAQTAGSSVIEVRAVVRVQADGVAELCLDLRDPAQGDTRLCPQRRFLNLGNAPEGQWRRSRSVFIGPEMSLWVRARRNGDLLDLSVGAMLDGEARGLRRSSWTWNWADAVPDRWVRTSVVAIELPGPTHPELWDPAPGIDSNARRLQIDEQAPNFRLPMLDGSSDDLRSLDAERSRADGATLVVFWSSWAPYVTDTLGVLTGLTSVDPDVIAIGVNVYDASTNTARRMASAYGSGLLHLVDREGVVAEHYRVDGVPEIFVIDGDGVWREVIRGAAPIAEIRAAIDRLR